MLIDVAGKREKAIIPSSSSAYKHPTSAEASRTLSSSFPTGQSVPMLLPPPQCSTPTPYEHELEALATIAATIRTDMDSTNIIATSLEQIRRALQPAAVGLMLSLKRCAPRPSPSFCLSSTALWCSGPATVWLIVLFLLLAACANPTPQPTTVAVQPTETTAATATVQPTGTATSPTSTARTLPTPSPVATRPIRPDRRIALTLFRNEKADVYLIHADGTGLVNLTNDPIGAGAGGPSWSPDGQRIAFSSSRAGNSDIYTIHPDGSNLVQLTTSEQNEVAPLWSPDGQHILFYAGARSDNSHTQTPNLFIMDADGSQMSHLTSGAHPVWSPDSRRILYENPARRDGIIHIINADGTDNRDLVNGFAPSWSPDGTRIAFQHRDQIHTVDPNGSDIELIADGASPDWSPDGTTIAFVTFSPEGRTISVMDPDGTNKRALTEQGDHLHPRWSPDGHSIAFTRGTTFGMDGGGLLVMNADGSNEVSLAFIGRVPQFTWEP